MSLSVGLITLNIQARDCVRSNQNDGCHKDHGEVRTAMADSLTWLAKLDTPTTTGEVCYCNSGVCDAGQLLCAGSDVSVGKLW